ncbi:hypothetical protein EDB89DRAFT_400371 [Lactarius sanguifluus]|nr:hypothetical protein EDB89DRAFT_400371 [Lactarius sanguifluus]
MHEMATEINKMKRDQLQKDVQSSLSPPDPSTNHEIASEAHHRGTTIWFFKGRMFAAWKASGSLLWVHGKPGSGKSILLSAIIRDIEETRVSGLASMAYYYFDFRDAEKQHLHGLLSSLLSQLGSGSDSRYEILLRLYSTHASGTRKPSVRELTHCLKDMLALPGQGPTYLIVDAFDECPNTTGMPSPREKVLGLIEELVNLSLAHGIAARVYRDCAAATRSRCRCQCARRKPSESVTSGISRRTSRGRGSTTHARRRHQRARRGLRNSVASGVYQRTTGCCEATVRAWRQRECQRQAGRYSPTYSDLEVVELLLDHGADFEVRNLDHKTPLLLALEHWRPEVGHCLVRRGANVSTRDKQDWTPLHLALQKATPTLCRCCSQMSTHKTGTTRHRCILRRPKGTSILQRYCSDGVRT